MSDQCIAGGSNAASTSAQPVLAFPALASFAGAPGAAAATATAASVQQVPPQQQPAGDESEATAARTPVEASARQPKDAPLLQINPAQLSRSSSQVASSPRGMQLGADPGHALDSGASSRSSSAAGFPLVLNDVAELPVGLMSAHVAASTADAGRIPQDSGSTDLLAAVNAVAGRLSLRHTASQSNYARMPSISEASIAAQDNTAASPAQPHSDAATAKNGSSQGLMFAVAAPGFRRTISNLRTGASLTASMAADLSRVTSSSGQLYRRTSQGTQLPGHQVQGEAYCQAASHCS